MQSTAKPFSEARPDLYIPDWLEAAVFETLEKDIEKRPKDMHALRQALSVGTNSSSQSPMRAISPSGRQVSAAPSTLTSRASLKSVTRAQPPAPKEHNMHWVLAALALVAIALSASFAYSMWCQSQEAAASVRAILETPPTQQKTPAAAQPITPALQEMTLKSITPVKSSHITPATAVTQLPKKATPSTHKTCQPRTVPASKNTQPPRTVQAAAPAPPKRHVPTSTSGRKSDYFDYVKHDHNYGDPQELPVKPWTGE